MSEQIYNWKRFWCPRTGIINLSDGGYLYVPDSEWQTLYHRDVVPFESIATVPCLGLLGEPGIGKTCSMQAQRKIIDTKVEEEGGQTLWLDLRSYGSEDRLVRDLFESTTFLSWAKGEHRLHVFLDSLDECLLRVDNVAAFLVDELRKYPVERLYLRIACRTAEWPNILEQGLRQLWGNDAVNVYELAPLRRVDVREAAKETRLDPEVFLDEINRMEIVPLSIKPITLTFLLNLYRRNGRFPSTQKELYFDGCRLLCEETSESRRDARRTGTYTADQRMTVAARIAAVTLFANRYAIWTNINLGEAPEVDVPFKELCGGSESVNGDQFGVNEAAIRETLGTGLFSSRGPYRMGWAHQTYAEFLAAWYLTKRRMPINQMMSLIVHPGDPEEKLVPQLHEVAAWLAGMVPNVFRLILKADPEVLLRSDVATADVRDRAELVEILLRLYDEEKLLDRDLDIRGRYGKLSHPDLAEQLRPYIFDRAKGIVVRRVAIEIAEACELRTLQGDLAGVALDPLQLIPIRVKAAYAVGHIGDSETKARLKPLVTGEAGDDPEDELKGCGLRAVWPGHITAEELFSVLTPPKRDNFSGAYQTFLLYDVEPHLQPADLPASLKWVEEQGSRHQMSYAFKKLMDTIMLQAWEHLELSGVLEAFAKAALSRLKHHDEIVGRRQDLSFRKLLTNDDEKRRRVIGAMVPILLDPEKDSMYLVYSERALVLIKDVPWMVERLRATKSKKDQRAWSYLIIRAFHWGEPEHLRAVLKARRHYSLLGKAFPWTRLILTLYFPRLFRLYLRLKTRNLGGLIPKQQLLKPPPAVRIAKLLDKCDSGNPEAWWRLNMEMTLEPSNTHYGDELESDLTVLPGWKAANLATRTRIVKAAESYILEQDPRTEEWLGTNTLHRPAFAGYRALRLLLQEEPGFLSTISADIWKKWTPIILAYPVASGNGDKESHQSLVKIAYQYAPDEIIQTLIVLIDSENAEHEYIFITRKVENCWDDRLANALLTKAKDEKLKPECMGCLLSNLLDHEVKEARAFAESLVPLPPPSNGEERSSAIVAACVLMTHCKDAAWSVVWPVLQQDNEFGRELSLKVAGRPDTRTATIGQRLTENQLADLFIWLVRAFPYAEDPKHEGAHAVGPRESVADFRDFLLSHLKSRGTPQACEAIQRIALELPELDWLKWTLLEAQTITRRHTWMPPRPMDILKIASDQQVRLVQSGDQLLDVLIESLKRLEAELQGETPAAIDLWNEIEKNVYRPKDENRLSDYIKRHLDEDLKQRGVIVNREVEIRRGEAPGQGERTDIHVDAVRRRTDGEVYDSIKCIVEAKGCWNPNLNQAMKTQLVDRYLADNPCQHGLYLIGWFNCKQWDNSDPRKRQAPALEIEEAQEQFDAQAAELSQQGMRIKALVINTALR